MILTFDFDRVVAFAVINFCMVLTSSSIIVLTTNVLSIDNDANQNSTMRSCSRRIQSKSNINTLIPRTVPPCHGRTRGAGLLLSGSSKLVTHVPTINSFRMSWVDTNKSTIDSYVMKQFRRESVQRRGGRRANEETSVKISVPWIIKVCIWGSMCIRE